MKKLKKAAVGILAGALCAASTAGVAVAFAPAEARAEVAGVQNPNIMTPTKLELNKVIKLSPMVDKNGSYFYFTTDSSSKPYTFEIYNDYTSNLGVLIRCYEMGTDTDNKNYAIDGVYVYPNNRFQKTYKSTLSSYDGVFKPNRKYMIEIPAYNGYINPDGANEKCLLHFKISHEGASAFTGLTKNTKGNWVYVKNGVFDGTYTGLARAQSGKWYYVKNGKYDTTFTGLAKAPSGKWYHVTKGKYDATYTGLSQAASGKWYYVRKGQYYTSYTGLTKAPSGKLYYVTKGNYNTKYNGKAVYNNKQYTVVNGRVK